MTRRTLALLLALVTVALLVITFVLLDRSFNIDLLSDGDKPSAVMGEPVPAISETPNSRIAAAGDTGTGDAAQQATVERMVLEGGEGHPYDALLLLGDLIYDDGEVELTDDRVIEPFSPITDAGAELLPVLGNHDIKSGDEEEIFTALGRPNSWYVEEVGPVRVVVLNSMKVEEDEQTEWLRRTLAAPQSPGTWTVVAMHHPAYSAGQHGSNDHVQDVWSPIFAEFDVPLVLAGHDHDYQRSFPQDGVTYVVSGGGAKLRPTGQEDFTAVSSSTLHFLDLLFYDDKIVARAIDQSGDLVDAFTIER